MDTKKGENPTEWKPSEERGSAGTQRNAKKEERCRLQFDLDRAMWKYLVNLKRGISVN